MTAEDMRNKAKLRAGDWKVTRHREQKDLGIETSITEEEYIELLRLRQKLRDKTTEKEL